MNFKFFSDSLGHTFVGSFLLDPEDVKASKSGEQSRTLVEEQGSNVLASECGAERARLSSSELKGPETSYYVQMP